MILSLNKDCTPINTASLFLYSTFAFFRSLDAIASIMATSTTAEADIAGAIQSVAYSPFNCLYTWLIPVDASPLTIPTAVAVR